MLRERKLLARISKSDRGLEIGPGYSPLLPKAGGWNVVTVDHADKATLVEKYRSHGVDVGRIEDVDIVWHGEPLETLLQPSLVGTFDFCVASHVIEHLPNPVQFIQSCGSVLKPGGILSLAVPDKRYCFDYFQPLTATGDILNAWFRNARVHSRRALFQHVANTITADDLSTWGQLDIPQSFRYHNDLASAFALFKSTSEDNDTDYCDCHAWHFTPSSFALIMLELSNLALIPFRIVKSFPASGCEFIVILENQAQHHMTNDDLAKTRIDLARRIVIELGEQAERLTPRSSDRLRRGAAALLRRLRGVVRRLRSR